MCFILYLLPPACHPPCCCSNTTSGDLLVLLSWFLGTTVSLINCSGNHGAWLEGLGRAQPPQTLESTKQINLPRLEPHPGPPAGEEKPWSCRPAWHWELCRRFNTAITRWCCCFQPRKVTVHRDVLILGRKH